MRTPYKSENSTNIYNMQKNLQKNPFTLNSEPRCITCSEKGNRVRLVEFREGIHSLTECYCGHNHRRQQVCKPMA